jgi:hypothetical protein
MPVSTARTQNLRRNRAVAQVLDAMRGGEILHLEFRRTGARWRLSGGQRIDSRAARLAIFNPDVIGDGDTLFPRTTSQTYRLPRKGMHP